ncbi:MULTISPECIES: DinB family protein [unclassified Nocardioides]|uniref:DinB family protein n=1 Tax=unclassified Nocardioides TaxID=2615069 RepID=UPI0006FB2E7F|nr:MULTISPECIES: DinB family protein [unclassified Nocardioides]KQY54206.1 mini-circle protein [Nocardioides sp. Root140]KQZ74831.1 mini-circle protein [Nocardioides sp. Root151]KRF10336.1 mini-circle protein [Nocardioides sp. Soil796]
MLEMVTVGPERAMLVNMLEINRQSLIECVEGLSEDDARRRLVPSLTTPLALLKHVACAERSWFQRRVAALPESEWDGYGYGDDASFAVTADDTVESAVAELRAAARRGREIADPLDLDFTIEHDHFGAVSLRWIYLHMIREVARHAGHADILREQIEAAPAGSS